MSSYIGLVPFQSGAAHAHVTSEDITVSMGKLRCGGMRCGRRKSRILNMLEEMSSKLPKAGTFAIFRQQGIRQELAWDICSFT